MINSLLTIDCQDCNGYGTIFFGDDNDFDCEPCDCQDGSLFKNGGNQIMYQITLSYDGNPIHWNKNYPDALEAFTAFSKFVDVGYANEYSTINLSMPTGKMYTKVIDRMGKVTIK